MTTLSQILGGLTGSGNSGSAGDHVGSVVWMHRDYPQDTFSDGGNVYLRTGVGIPYSQADHAAALAAGLGIKKWMRQFKSYVIQDPYQQNLNTGGDRVECYAFGESGYLIPLNAGTSSLTAGSESYSFENSTIGLSKPVTVIMPLLVTPEGGGMINQRSFPTYLPLLKRWAYVEYIRAYSNTFVAGVRVYLSADGENWTSFVAPLGTSSLQPYGMNGYSPAIRCVGFGDCLAVMWQSANGSQNYDCCSIIKIASDCSQSVGSVLAYSGGSSSVFSIRSFGPDTFILNTAPSTNTQIFDYRTALDAKPSMTYSAGANASYFLSMCRGGKYLIWGGNGAMWTGTNPLALVQRGISVFGTTLDSTARLVWTGKYFFIYMPGSVPGYYAVSTDSVSWGQSGAGDIGSEGQIYRDHYIRASDSKPVNSTTGLVVTTSETGFNSLVPASWAYFNGTLIGVGTMYGSLGGILAFPDGFLARPDLRLINTAAGVPVGTASRLKEVNGRLFVLNCSAGYLVHSADGVTWTTVNMTSTYGGVIRDVDFIGGKWVATGAYDGTKTAAGATSTDLASWTATNPLAGQSVNVLLNCGANLVALAANGSARYSPDGTTWTAVTGTITPTFSGNAAGVVDSGVAYLFAPNGLASSCRRAVSSDGGVTWTSAAVSLPPVQGTTQTNTCPLSFAKFNGSVYAIVGTTLTNSGTVSSGVPYQCNLAAGTFSTVSLPVDSAVYGMPNGWYPELSGLFSTGSLLVTMVVNGQSYGLSYYTAYVIDASGTASYIGTDTEVTGDGGIVGFVRIK